MPVATITSFTEPSRTACLTTRDAHPLLLVAMIIKNVAQSSQNSTCLVQERQVRHGDMDMEKGAREEQQGQSQSRQQGP